MLHLLPDEGDEARSIIAAKKFVVPVQHPCGTNGSQHAAEECTSLLSTLCSQLFTVVEVPPADGMLPQRKEIVNPHLHQLTVTCFGAIQDMSCAWWSSSSSPVRRSRSSSIEQPTPVVPKHVMLSSVGAAAATLRTVVLSHNYSLEKLPLEALHALPNLNYLDLSYNALVHLPPKLLFSPSAERASGLSVAFPNLLSLKLNNNKLKWVPKELFSVLPVLEELSVENNALVCLPSTLGNHCTEESALQTLTLWNNALVEEEREAREVMLVLGEYNIQLHRDDEFFADLRQPLDRAEVARRALERQRLPAMVEPPVDGGDCGPISCDATTLMVRLLRSERERQAQLLHTKHASEPVDFYSDLGAPHLESVMCNMCQCKILPFWSTFCDELALEFDRRERAALGPRYKELDCEDYSFFLDGEKQQHGRRKRELPDDFDIASCAAWQTDVELLFLLGAAILGTCWSGTARPPVAYVKFVDVAANKDVPLVYMTCGSTQCRAAVSSLATDANTVCNFSRVDYTNLTDPEASDGSDD